MLDATGAPVAGPALVVQAPGGMRPRGYPAFAVAGFLLAAGLEIFLLAEILFTDRQ